ncbi:transposase family protein [Sinorhizobium fredii]|uniref:transposase family protein n=1 Tax=Rhizobium fredii TaxID=380 RepID=UPI0009B6EB34
MRDAARPAVKETCCPCCGLRTCRVHSHYQRQLADLPWHGRVVEVRLQARRLRCVNPDCLGRIFTERLIVQKQCCRKLMLSA